MVKSFYKLVGTRGNRNDSSTKTACSRKGGKKDIEAAAMVGQRERKRTCDGFLRSERCLTTGNETEKKRRKEVILSETQKRGEGLRSYVTPEEEKKGAPISRKEQKKKNGTATLGRKGRVGTLIIPLKRGGKGRPQGDLRLRWERENAGEAINTRKPKKEIQK